MKISQKLILAVGLVAVVSIALISIAVIRSEQNALIAQVENTAHQLSETIKSSTKFDMLMNHTDRVHHIIDMVSGQENIEDIRIFNKEGNIIYASDSTVVGKMLDKEAESCYACHAEDEPLRRLSVPERTRIFSIAGHRKLGIINPIYNEPGCWQADCHAHSEQQSVLGVLDVTLPLDEIDAQIHENRTQLALFAFFAIVAISFIIWLLVHHLIGKPVGKLVAATNALAKGDMKYKIPVSASDELGNLARSFNDMTMRLADAQKQIYQSEKLASVGKLAAGVAHEINNPLTGVLTYSSFLQKRFANGDIKVGPDENQIIDDLNVIVHETKRCRDIVKGLLDFSRQAPARKSAVSLNNVIEHTLGILQNPLQIKNIQVTCKLAADPAEVYADANQIEQVFINIIVNASDAIGKTGGEINITTKQQGQWVVVTISDTGCGISLEERSKIFDPFYSTKGRKGTGLGLAVVWGIVQEHKGEITVASEVGEGTTFTLKFPAHKGGTLLIDQEDEDR